jgi:type VI secretion system protein ImpG
MMRGQKIDMEVDATQFAELGDVYLFGTLMDNFFSAYTSMNIYTQFNLKEINSGVLFKWKARVGNRILI